MNRAIGWVALLCVLTSAGCASKPPAPLVSPGSRVQIVSMANAEVEQEIRNKAINESASTGTAVGAGVGAVALGIYCGPFFFLCAPIGALVGTVPGGLAGSAVGNMKDLSEERREKLESVFSEFMASHDLQAELDEAVARRAGDVWTVVEQDPAYTIGLEVTAVTLSAHHGDQIVLNVAVNVALDYVDASGREEHRADEFSYAGSPVFVETWIEEGGEYASRTLEECYQFLADNIVAGLTRPRYH